MNHYAVVHCGQLVPIKGPILNDGAFIVQDGKIVWVGPTDAAPADLPTVDAEGKVVTPGLVDAHTHTVFAANRVEEFEMRSRGATYQEIAENGGGIRSTMEATRQAADLEAQVRAHQLRLVRNGTTTFETKTGYGLSPKLELQHLDLADAGVATVRKTFLGAHALPPEFEGDVKGYIAALTQVLPEAKAKGASAVDAFIEPGYFTPDAIRPYLEAAKSLGLGIHLHVDQLGPHQGAQFAAEMLATTADHLEFSDEAGIRALMRAGVTPVLLPASVYGLGKGKYPDAKAMMKAGMAFCLATDYNPGSSPTSSLPFVMGLACRYMGMSPAQALVACTMIPSTVLGLQGQKGAIDVGCDADFVIWPYKDYREIAYWIGDVLPERVAIAGKFV
ncbi:MAG: imidazolonepropionase [Fimbriimonadaceae bacterium]|nr:imidazolonepropionase [Fimbriimonadaceae bacterium]